MFICQQLQLSPPRSFSPGASGGGSCRPSAGRVRRRIFPPLFHLSAYCARRCFRIYMQRPGPRPASARGVNMSAAQCLSDVKRRQSAPRRGTGPVRGIPCAASNLLIMRRAFDDFEVMFMILVL
ncbi:hypothetical protein EVAR_27817_1 [Eumeta japonica]|uniref:Uncharacterized protein n=1 Tax=Eumeta variegata TaxID=151549 RepID=A0A4C1VJC0_EUMVA|nr:hypothetical protein EVAR_27817_1 [Eumeta japonica]